MPSRTNLNVSLRIEQGGFIQSRIASGCYSSASEVVRTALRLLEKSEHRDLPATGRAKAAAHH